jgi:hypothetical protein
VEQGVAARQSGGKCGDVSYIAGYEVDPPAGENALRFLRGSNQPTNLMSVFEQRMNQVIPE